MSFCEFLFVFGLVVFTNEGVTYPSTMPGRVQALSEKVQHLLFHFRKRHALPLLIDSATIRLTRNSFASPALGKVRTVQWYRHCAEAIGTMTAPPNQGKIVSNRGHLFRGPLSRHTGRYTEASGVEEIEIRRIVCANGHRIQRSCSGSAWMLNRCSGNARRDQRLLMKEAIEGHLECMREFGYAIPKPTTVAELVEIPV